MRDRFIFYFRFSLMGGERDRLVPVARYNESVSIGWAGLWGFTNEFSCFLVRMAATFNWPELAYSLLRPGGLSLAIKSGRR